MRAAPAVNVRSDGGWLWQALRWGLPAISVAAATTWLLLQAGAGTAWAACVALLMALGTAIIAARSWPARSVHLGWDGQQWQADGHPVQPQVMVDLGGWMLLRLRLRLQAPGEPGLSGLSPLEGVRWMALSPLQCGAAMGPLRAAVYCFATESNPGSRMRAPE